jgi:hypothetical protein
MEAAASTENFGKFFGLLCDLSQNIVNIDE